MSKRIVLLSGSPRKGGNTDLLADAFIGGARHAGKDIVPYRVADMTIGPCRACQHCSRKGSGTCIQKDDMPAVLDAMRKADALVLASPVYFFGVTAQLKTAIDRMFALLWEKLPITKAGLLLTCGAATIDAADASVAMFRQILAYQRWEEAGIVIAPGLQDPGQIAGRPELEKARALGAAI